MINEEKKMVMDLVLNSITRAEFLKHYPVDIQRDSTYILKLLQAAYSQKGSEDVEYALLLGFSFGVPRECISILNKLLTKSWHCKHEDISRLLKDFKDPSSVEPLYQTALAEYDYLDYDDSYALAVKCIWALGDINTDASKESLEKLLLSENRVVRESAEKQLSRDIS